MDVTLIIKERNAKPVERHFTDTFFDKVVEEGWRVGEVVQFGEEVGWERNESFIVESITPSSQGVIAATAVRIVICEPILH